MVAGMLSDIKCHKRKTIIQKEKQKQRSDEDVVRELVSMTSRTSGQHPSDPHFLSPKCLIPSHSPM